MVQWDKPSRVRTDHVTTRTIVLSHNQQTIAQQAPAKYSRLSHSYMYSGLILKNSIHAAVDSHSPLQKKHEKAEHCFAVIGSYMNFAAQTQREALSVGNSHRSAGPRPTTLEEDREIFVDFSSNFMFMIWDSRYEDLQFFWLSFKHWKHFTHKHLETQGCILSTVATDGLQCSA